MTNGRSITRWTIRFVCTGRKQHESTWLNDMVWSSVPLDPDDDDVDYEYDSCWTHVFLGQVQTMQEHGWYVGTPAYDTRHPTVTPPMVDAEVGSGFSQRSYEFKCSRCRRRPKIDKDRLRTQLDNARDNRVPLFDVSYLP
jgi:hypothetical protein